MKSLFTLLVLCFTPAVVAPAEKGAIMPPCVVCDGRVTCESFLDCVPGCACNEGRCGNPLGADRS